MTKVIGLTILDHEAAIEVGKKKKKRRQVYRKASRKGLRRGK